MNIVKAQSSGLGFYIKEKIKGDKALNQKQTETDVIIIGGGQAERWSHLFEQLKAYL